MEERGVPSWLLTTRHGRGAVREVRRNVENSRFGSCEQDALESISMHWCVKAPVACFWRRSGRGGPVRGEHADHRDENGHALVVRNGVAEPRR